MSDSPQPIPIHRDLPPSPTPNVGDSAWDRWLASPPGQYVMRWESTEIAAVVADLFGYHAVQLGLPQLDALAANRMPLRLLADTRWPADDGQTRGRRPDLLVSGFGELPFDTQSLDLVVLPHQLEFAPDPHQLLREVDRVLRPDGRLVVVGFNPLSLWGLRQLARKGPFGGFVPVDESLLGAPRVRDWLKLLSFEIDGSRYGCYVPPCRTGRWLERMRFLEVAGDRWWPICGAVYLVAATKRVRGMHLVGPAWRRRPAPKAAPAVAISGRSSHRSAGVAAFGDQAAGLHDPAAAFRSSSAALSDRAAAYSRASAVVLPLRRRL